MINHPSEQTLALYSTGDLEESELRSITDHVAACEACRDCAGQFAQMQQMLMHAAVEPSAGELLEVRRRVIGALEGRRQWRIAFQWAAAAAALVALAVLLHPKHRSASLVPPAPKIAIVQPPLVAPAPIISAQRVLVKHRPRLAGMRSVALVTRPGEEPFMKIATTDPNIIILLPPDAQNQKRTESNDE